MRLDIQYKNGDVRIVMIQEIYAAYKADVVTYNGWGGETTLRLEEIEELSIDGNVIYQGIKDE